MVLLARVEREAAVILIAEDDADGRLLDTPTGPSRPATGMICSTPPASSTTSTSMRPRAHGAGRALVTAMFATLKAKGAPRVVLLTAWKKPDAHAFFEALGFRRTMLEMTAGLVSSAPRYPAQG